MKLGRTLSIKQTGFGLTCFVLGFLIFCPNVLGTRVSGGKSARVVPFELVNNHIYVRVRVNDSRPLSFILDTGAHSIIQTRHARSIGLKLKLIGQAGGVGANQPDVHEVMDKVSLGLAGIVFSPRRLVAVSLDVVETCVNEFSIDREGRLIASNTSKQDGPKRELDGILGKQFFDQFVVEIDYAQRFLTVYDRSSYKYAGSGKEIPLEIGEQHIFAKAQIRVSGRPLTGRFLLDTGSAHALSLMKPFIHKHNLLPSTEGMTALPVCGLGGHEKEKSWIGSLEELQLGEFKISDPVTEFRLADPNTDADGVIGGALFRRFRVIFDYSRRRMILEPRSDLK
jgi:hypothetical protein